MGLFGKSDKEKEQEAKAKHEEAQRRLQAAQKKRQQEQATQARAAAPKAAAPAAPAGGATPAGMRPAGANVPAAQAPAPAPAADQTYTVASGDSLSKIAKKHLGNANRWREIYDANKSVIGDNPDLIKPGQKLRIPGGGGSAPRQTA